MTADPSLLIEGDFVLVRMALVDLVGWSAAAVLQRIHFRCDGSPDGRWRATHADIAAEVRLSLRVVERVTKELRDAGWLLAERASSFDPTTVWSIPGSGGFVPAKSAVTVPAKSAVTPSLEEGKKDAQPPLLATPFDQFWRAYPRKVGKGAARKAFLKAEEKVGPSLLVDRAEAYAEHVVAAKVEDSFIKHPATWLNQECWDDVLPTRRARSTAPSAWR